MRSKSKGLFLFCLMYFFCASLFAQLNWPFPVPNQQATVAGSVGEYRFTAPNTHRFHQGVDLTNGTNHAVHAILAGTVQWNGQTAARTSKITITPPGGGISISYVHVLPIAGIQDRTITQVSGGDYIGEMIVEAGWRTHVHLESPTENFLNHNLSPYVDLARPYFSNDIIPNGVAFYQNGLLKSTPTTDLDNLLLDQTANISGTSYTLLYNKVDIVTQAIDPWVNSDGTDGGHSNVPSEISWTVTNYFSNVNVELQRLRFDGIPSNNAANAGFHPLSRPPDDAQGIASIHIITSNPTNYPWDRFWNTGLRVGQTETYTIANPNATPPVVRPANLDARSNIEARYPDGPYRVTINSNDVDYNDNPNNTADPPRTVNVLVDNFRPYIKEVTVRKNDQNGRLVYRGAYDWNTTTRQLTLTSTPGDDMDPSSRVWIKIVTSEPCQNIQVNISPTDGTTFQTASVNNTNHTEFIFTRLPIVWPPIGTQQQINITGQDWAGNPLQTDPTLQPVRQSDGTWSAGVAGGTDSNHSFKTGTNTCTATGGSTGGRIAAGSRTASTSCLYADITSDKTYISTKEPITLSPVTSGAGLLTYSWDFGAGATPAKSTSSGPQTVFYTSGGQKTITLQVCDQSKSCQTAQKIIQVIDGTATSTLSVDFTASQTAANTGQAVQLTSTVTGAVGNVSYLWSFDNGTSQGILTDANPTISYYLNSSGSKTISLTVTDNNGSVTKTKPGYLTIISPYFNVVPSIGGCVTTGADGVVSFSNTVSGGNGAPYSSYLWDFGDGTTSTSQAGLVSHTYIKSGKFTVRLTVCDETGCGTDEKINCVTVPSIVDNSTLTPNFVINNVSFGTAYSPLQVGLNTPVIFTDATAGGGSPLSYSWDFDSHYNGGSSQSSVPSTSTLKGPVEVYYTTAGYKEVSLTVVNSTLSRRETKPDVVNVTKGLGKGTCFASLGTATVSTTCWSTTNLPKFSIPVPKTNCPVAKTEVTYWTNGVGSTGYVLPNGVLDFKAMGIATPAFPLTADFSFTVYQFDGISYNYIGYKRQRFTIYGPETADAGPDKQVCLSGSAILGASSSVNSYSYSYLWSSSNATALSLLSDGTVANPVFLGAQKGTYNYGLTVTNLETGCKSQADNVTVAVDRPEIGSKSYSVTPGSSTLLSVSSTGGFGGDNFLWSPSTNLSASNISNPTFTSPQEGTFNYDISVTDKVGCSSTGLVIVDASTSPGNLVAKAAAYSRISLTWLDRSTASTGFLIQRSADGTTYENYATVGAAITNFDDVNVTPGTTYYYKVAAQLSGGGLSGFSNVASIDTKTLPPFTSISSNPTIQGVHGDFDNDGDVDFAIGYKYYKNNNGVFVPSSLPSSSYSMAVDFDDDNDLDLFSPADGAVLRNDNGTFTLLAGVSERSIPIWNLTFDYNRDNKVDILYAKNNSTFRTLMNLDNNTFSNIDSGIPAFFSAEWLSNGEFRTFSLGDIDNDGDEDLVAGDQATKVYLNEGQYSTSNFNVVDNGCCGSGTIGLFDSNSDSKLDVFADGIGSPYLSKNLGGLSFSRTNNNFSHETFSYNDIGDFDMDGDMDIMLSQPLSYLGESYGTRVYRNNDDGSFPQYFHDVNVGSKWVDVDGDGDLDIATGKGIINNLGTNKYTNNTRPQAPAQTCGYLDGDYVVLTWNRGSDAETSSEGLTYNLYVKADGKMIMSPLSDLPTGFRKVVKRGNVDQNTTWRIYVGYASYIEWGVQSIDNSFVGSIFSNSVLNLGKNICGDLISTTYNGVDLFAGYSCTTTVASSVNVNFEATKVIKLGPGFSVALGGAYNGKMVPPTNPNPCSHINTGGRIGNIANSNSPPIDTTPEVTTSPNPGSGTFSISSDLNGTYDKVEISVCLISGEPILSKTYTNISSISDNFDISQYPGGVYIVKVNFGSQIKFYRIIKL